jgi:hypothetical protein
MPNPTNGKETKFLLFILMLAAVLTILLSLFVKPRQSSADTPPPATSWNAEQQCQMYRNWCFLWPNCGPCADGKPVVLKGWLEAELAKPANSRKF